jgi:hypothetical protein
MDEEARKRRNTRERARYANDAEYREKRKAANRKRYANDNKFRERQIANGRERYASDSEFREKRKATSRASRLKCQYGISLQEHADLLHRQNYACGICERPFRETPHVDHCHLTRWVRGLLCRKCNIGMGHFEDNPVFLFKAALYALRWYLHLLQVFNKQVFNREEHDMTTNDDSGGDSKASRMMRSAILHELHQPFGVDELPPADKLQAVARALVNKAAAQDISAIKEILDRIDGRTPSTLTLNDLPQLVNLSWKLPSSPSEMSSPNTHPSRKSKSTTARVANSSPSTHQPSGSPAS